MYLTFYDNKNVTQKAIAQQVKKLQKPLTVIQSEVAKDATKTPYASLATWKDEAMLASVHEVVATFTKPKHVVLVGIGGSSLGVEAIHAVLAANTKTTLHVLDTVAPHELEAVLAVLAKVKKASDIAVCVVSKSGNTIETMANAEVVVGTLVEQFGKVFWEQVVCIGDVNTAFLKTAAKRKAKVVPMPKQVGGRYSVFTPVGLVPLALLGHDIEAILAGVEDAATEPFQAVATENAARLYLHLKAGVKHYNFFAFDTRLVRLGKWYRQLSAESLGKEKTRGGKAVTLGFVPTVSTAVDLHSIGQLYFAQFAGVYTDFVAFNDDAVDYKIPARPLVATTLAKHTQQDIAAAIYAGVVDAYQQRALPYRSTIFDEGLDYSLGLFMATRMLETMLVAELMDVDAFNQPNVELYKQQTKRILGL